VKVQVIQIFGIKGPSASRAAERFFKERRIPIQFIDLKQKSMAPGEIGRFVEKFSLRGLLDADAKVYDDFGLKYLKVSDSELLQKIEKEPKLLRLPLVCAGQRLAIGSDEGTWKIMAESQA
jgi:arsenate reductase-like glutaredoxin family protein